MPTLPTKCTVCGKSSPEVEFYNNFSLRRCKVCHKKQCNERRWKKKESPEYCQELKAVQNSYWLENRPKLIRQNKDRWLRKKIEQALVQSESPASLKGCRKCGQIKTVSDFYIGLPNICKTCEKSRARKASLEMYHRNKKLPGFAAKVKAKQKRLIEENLNYRIAARLRTRLYIVLRRDAAKRGAQTFDLLGCDIESFKLHIEAQFKPGMTWENYGKFGWHLDHIKACANFDLTKKEEQEKCFHYTNFQPLWWRENLEKGKKSY